MSSIPESSRTWVLWYDECVSDSLSPDQFLERCLRFEEVLTVDEFRKSWRTLVNGGKSIRKNANLRLFRQGVEPVASASANRRGAKLVVSFVDTPFVDAWHTLVSALLNDELAPSDFVTGLVLSVNETGSAIQVWIGDAARLEDTELIKCQLKLLLDTPAVHLSRHTVAAEAPPYHEYQPPQPDHTDDEPAAAVLPRLRVEPSSRCYSSRRKHVDDAEADTAHFDSCAFAAKAMRGAVQTVPVRANDVAKTDAALDSSSSDDEVDMCLKRIGVMPTSKLASRLGRPCTAKPASARSDSQTRMSAAADFLSTLLLIAVALFARLCAPTTIFGANVKAVHCPSISTMYYDTYCRNSPKDGKDDTLAPVPLRSRKCRRSMRAFYDAYHLPAAATLFGFVSLASTLCLQTPW